MSRIDEQTPTITFAENVWFVRPTSEAERKEHGHDKCDENCYTVVDADGKMLAIVNGESDYAFQLIRNEEALPQWMH